MHKAERRALEAAYKELQRRLKDLNHAHAQVVSDRSEFVRYEAWKVGHDTVIEKIDLVNAGLIELRANAGGSEAAKESNRAVWAIGIAAISAFASVAAVIIVALVH